MTAGSFVDRLQASTQQTDWATRSSRIQGNNLRKRRSPVFSEGGCSLGEALGFDHVRLHIYRIWKRVEMQRSNPQKMMLGQVMSGYSRMDMSQTESIRKLNSLLSRYILWSFRGHSIFEPHSDRWFWNWWRSPNQHSLKLPSIQKGTACFWLSECWIVKEKDC